MKTVNVIFEKPIISGEKRYFTGNQKTGSTEQRPVKSYNVPQNSERSDVPVQTYSNLCLQVSKINGPKV